MTAFQPALRPYAARPPAEETPHVATRLAVWSILAFWAFYYVLNTARMALDAREAQLEMLPRRAVVTLVGICLTSLIYLLLPRFEGRSMRMLLTIAFAPAVPSTLAYAYLNYPAFYLLSQTG